MEENPLAADLRRELNRQIRLKLLGARGAGRVGRDDLVFGSPPKRRTRIPSLNRLDRLMHQVEVLPAGRRLTAAQIKVYRDLIVRIYRALLRFRWETQRLQHRARQEAYEARIGRLFLDSSDYVLENFLTGRR